MLLVCILALNAGLAVYAAIDFGIGWGAGLAVAGAPPALLLTAARADPFRGLAALMSAVYFVGIVATLFFGGVLFVPTALLLLAAALAPDLDPRTGRAQTRRGRVAMGVVAALVALTGWLVYTSVR